jgi:cytochrome c peroxidase
MPVADMPLRDPERNPRAAVPVHHALGFFLVPCSKPVRLHSQTIILAYDFVSIPLYPTALCQQLTWHTLINVHLFTQTMSHSPAFLLRLCAVFVTALSLSTTSIFSADATQDAARITLGSKIFFDTRLSGDGSISCATCHQPEKAFTDGRAIARGVHGHSGTRNTPSLWNVSSMTSLFWEGRRTTLEQQATDPLLNPREHGMQPSQLLASIRADERYRALFLSAFGIQPGAIELEHVSVALSAFQRTLTIGDSPFDRYQHDGKVEQAMEAAAVRGLSLFRGSAQCASCHPIDARFALFTDHEFHSLGVGVQSISRDLPKLATSAATMSASQLDRAISDNPQIAALGRYLVTKDPRDIGKFKTPSLRNVALTAPYMHDGSVATLSEAVEFELYYRGIESGRPLILTPAEKEDLLAFLKALTSPAANGALTTHACP